VSFDGHCAGDDGGVRGPGTPWDPDDPTCHWDCFRTTFCDDCVVYEVVHAPVPCHMWTGMCPTTTLGTCASGCGDRPPVGDADDWELFCEGSEESRPGDPCAIEVAPPALGDAGAACSVSFDALSGAYGVVADPTCSSGWCAFIAYDEPSCDLHGCAVACEDQWDCPPTLDCGERVDWTGRSVDVGGLPERIRVCGEPTDSLLLCHSAP
jgi:hypothetical protein